MASIRALSPWLLGTLVLSTACVDALRLEPPTGSGSGGSGNSTGSTQGAGGGEAIPCNSNSECPEPTSVCDTVQGLCVECLVLSDCGFRPGTVCSEGACVCPDKLSYCGPSECVDLTTSPVHCGKCGHACFGLCAAGTCVDPWEPVAAEGAPSARSNHVAVWTGSKMVVWGGLSNGSGNGAVATGGVYDPTTYTWTTTSPVGAPKARYDATAVWTGTEMVVWGGLDSHGLALNDGARFDPTKNAWTPISLSLAPTPRGGHSAVWTGSEMIVWGGKSDVGELSNGARYNPTTNAWTLIMTYASPQTARTRHCAVWDKAKSLMNVVGGFGDNVTDAVTDVYFPNGTARALLQYAPVGENWYNTGEPSEPSARSNHTCVYDGLKTIVFGGMVSGTYHPSGAAWDPTLGWTTIGGTLPEPRADHSAVWLDTQKVMVTFGGRNPNPLDSGDIYNSASNSWIGQVPRALSARYSHTAVATGDRMIVWGGTGPMMDRLANGGIYTYKP